MNVQLGTAIAAPGSRATGWLAVETAPGEQTQIPVVVINGGQPGPRLAITAGIHGGEYTGPAALRSLLLSPEAGDPATLASLKGSIIATLATNPVAFKARSIYVNPQDGKNLNRVYPGSATGSASERIAHAIATQLMTGADVYMDLHAGDINEALSPFVGIEQTGDAARDARAVALGRAVGAEWLLIGASPGTTTSTAEQLGAIGILCEFGGQGHVEPEFVARHAAGVRGVIAEMGIGDFPQSPIERETGPLKPGASTRLDSEAWLRAEIPTDVLGYWHPTVAVGSVVKKGEKLGEVQGVFGDLLQAPTAPIDGVVIFLVTTLAMNNGDPLLALGGDPEGGVWP
jgi:predicted deacylase